MHSDLSQTGWPESAPGGARLTGVPDLLWEKGEGPRHRNKVSRRTGPSKGDGNAVLGPGFCDFRVVCTAPPCAFEMSSVVVLGREFITRLQTVGEQHCESVVAKQLHTC